MSSLVGSWYLIETKDYDKFLSEIGIENYIIRLLDYINPYKIDIEFDHEKTWTIKIRGILVRSSHKFKHNKEFWASK